MPTCVKSSVSKVDREYTPDPALHDGLVFRIAEQYRRRAGDLEIEDLIQSGRIGLVIACRRYDRSMGSKFSTYAVHWIKRFIRDEIMNCGHYIRIPKYHHTVCPDRISEGTREAGQSAFSVRKHDDRGIDVYVDESSDPCEMADELDRLGAALDRLNPDAWRIISDHFGLGGRPSVTLRDLAKRMGMSYCKVRAVYDRGMGLLESLLSEGSD